MKKRYTTISDFGWLYDVCKEYERIFGEGSLQRCIEFLNNPAFSYGETIKCATKTVEEAVENASITKTNECRRIWGNHFLKSWGINKENFQQVVDISCLSL